MRIALVLVVNVVVVAATVGGCDPDADVQGGDQRVPRTHARPSAPDRPQRPHLQVGWSFGQRRGHLQWRRHGGHYCCGETDTTRRRDFVGVCGAARPPSPDEGNRRFDDVVRLSDSALQLIHEFAKRPARCSNCMCSPRYASGRLETTWRSRTNPSVQGPSIGSGWTSTTAMPRCDTLGRGILRVARRAVRLRSLLVILATSSSETSP